MKTAILASYYRDAFHFVSTDAARFNLHGVALCPLGRVVATDGHCLFIANAAHGEGTTAGLRDDLIIIPADKKLFAACKAGKRDYGSRYLVIETDATGVTVLSVVHAPDAASAIIETTPSAFEFTLRTQLVDGSFPDWTRIVPQVPADPIAHHPAFDMRLLARFGQVTGSEKQIVRVIPCGDEASPAYVELSREDAFGVLMPIRGEWISEQDAEGHRTCLYRAAMPVRPEWSTASAAGGADQAMAA